MIKILHNCTFKIEQPSLLSQPYTNSLSDNCRARQIPLSNPRTSSKPLNINNLSNNYKTKPASGTPKSRWQHLL